MADGRMLKRVITRSDKLAALNSDKARLLWFYMLPYTDVEGRIEAKLLDIREDIIRRQKRGFSLAKVAECLKDLDRVGLIELYEVRDGNYLRFTRFHDEQKIRRDREAASLIPAPLPERDRTTPRKVKPSPSPSEDKLSEVKPSPSEEKPKLGVGKNSLEGGGLGLSKQVQVRAMLFGEELDKVFPNISRDEATTFLRVAQHLSEEVILGAPIEIFDEALGWAKKAMSSNARNPKGLFIAKVKEQTDFTGRGKLLNRSAGQRSEGQ